MWAYKHTFLPVFFANSEHIYDKMTDCAIELIKFNEDRKTVPLLIRRSKFLLTKIEEGIKMYMKQTKEQKQGAHKNMLEFLETFNAIQRRSNDTQEDKILKTTADWVCSICVLLHFGVSDTKDGTGPYEVETPPNLYVVN